MARVIKYTKAFKKQFKKRRQDPKWRSIFKSSLPQEFDDQKRSPWKYIIQCLIEDKTIPDYFYPHALEGVTMEKQETTRKKKRFDMKRSFRRISAVIATMAFTTGLAACGSSQSTCPIGEQSHFLRHCPQGWKKFTSKDLGYSVYFPGVPEKDTYKDPTGAYARYSTVNDKDHINYAVSVTKFTRKQVEDSSVIMRREVVYSSAGLYGLESFGTSSSEYKQFVDTFRLSEDTQEWKEGLHDFRHWLYLLPGDARPGLDGSRHGGRDRSGHHRRDRRRHLRHQILANTLQGMVGLRSLYTDEVVDSHQIMMMNNYMPTKVNDLYKALLSLG